MLWLVTLLALSQCSKDTDCKGDRICSQGTCVDSDAPKLAPAPVSQGVRDALKLGKIQQLKTDIAEMRAELEDATLGGPIAKVIIGSLCGVAAGIIFTTSWSNSAGLMVLVPIGLTAAAIPLFMVGLAQLGMRIKTRRELPDEIEDKEAQLRRLTGGKP